MRVIRKHPKSRQHTIYTAINTFINFAHSIASLYIFAKTNSYHNPTFHDFIDTKRPFHHYFPWKNTLNLNNDTKRYENRLRYNSYRINHLSSFRTYYNIQIHKINKKKNVKER
jgi:hypothetical protein